MNAFVSKTELALMPVTHASHAQHAADARSRNANPIAALFGSMKSFFQRQSTMAELNDLSDRELADIGLNRSELQAVFDPAFNARRGR